VARRGGAASEDYWGLATVLELAIIGRDYESAEGVVAKVLDAASASWMAKTTADNLDMLLRLRKDKEDTALLEKTIAALRRIAAKLPG
jgi:hypothetical protein